MASEFHYQRRVEFADTDRAGIVHFARYLCYAEEAEHAFLRSLGLSVHVPADGHSVGFPRRAVRVEYRRPIRFEDLVDVHIWVHRKGARSLTYHYRMTHDGETVAVGEVVAVCVRFCGEGVAEAVPLPERFSTRIDEAPYPALEFREASR